jgi:hypothetical protein
LSKQRKFPQKLFLVSKLTLFFFSFFQSNLYSADPGVAAIKAENAPYNQALKTMQAKAEQQELMKTQMPQAAAKQQEGAVVIVDPVTRAQDFKEAFTFLSTHKAGSMISFEMQSGEKLTNILDVSVMKGGSLLIFKINSTQGLKYKVAKIEDIKSLGTEP